MDVDEALFRPEAIDYQRSFRGPGQLQATGAQRNERLFWALLTIGLVSSLLISVEGEPLVSALLHQLHGLVGVH
jgi:hypothetical protein